MNRIHAMLKTTVLIATLAMASSLAAQRELVRVTIQPDYSGWEWESYAESVNSLFANSIENRVSEGIDSREFEESTETTVLTFAFRIGQNGELIRFSPLKPDNRYHAYLIRRTAGKVAPFRPLPGSFPLFYFDGLITFECGFTPTRWYKKLYFEQPIDTLKTPSRPLIIRKPVIGEPLLSTYEPVIQDKKKLLDEFKSRIGVAEEITDTSSYSPLAVSGRMFLVRVPYDSIDGDPLDKLLLQTRLERALEEAGAKIANQDYDPEEVRQRISREALDAANDSADAADSAMASTADTTEPESAVIDLSEEQLLGLPEGRNLATAFSTVFKNRFLVLSAALARDSTGDSALCRIRLYQSDSPDELKRNLNVKFNYESLLPDSIGIRLIQRLTAPPAKPKPPAPPKKAAPAAADSSAAPDAVQDSSAADNAGAAAIQQADSTGTGAARPTQSDSISGTAVQPIPNPPSDSAASKEPPVTPAPDSSAYEPAPPADSIEVSPASDTAPDSPPDSSGSGSPPEQ